MATSFKTNTEGRSGDWRVIVYNEPWCDRVKIYLAQQHNGRLYLGSIDKDGFIEMKEHPEGSAKDRPLMVLGRYAWQAMADCFSQVVPETKIEVVDAELKATKYHLEDMRALVFRCPKKK